MRLRSTSRTTSRSPRSRSCIDRCRWGEYESRVVRNTHRLLELLDRHRVKATFFVLGWIAPSDILSWSATSTRADMRSAPTATGTA